MEFSHDQHLQNVTLGKIQLPLKNKGCQELLTMDGITWKGWLRRKKPWKIPGGLSVLLQSIAWDRKFVVIHNGCMYFYNNESDSKPDKAISLFGYTRVMRADELRTGREVLWPFKVAYVLDENDRVHYFSASCEKDMMTWLKHIKQELYRANGVEYSSDVVTDEDIHDLETPISTGNYFDNLKDLKKIKEVVGTNADDSDMDDDYDYLEPVNPSRGKSPGLPTVPQPPKKRPETTGFQNQPQIVKSHTSKAATSLPPSPLPGYRLPLKPDTVSTPKPLPPIPGKNPPKNNVPPVPPLKTKRNEKLSTEESSSSKSAMRVLLASSSDQEDNSAKPIPASKPFTKSTLPAPPKSMALPPLPLSARQTSKVPTAVVSPVPSSTTTDQDNRFLMDLESEAMWTENPGEGQRLLVSLAQEGVYMLRPCTDGSSALTLLVIADCQLRKYKILKDAEEMFSLVTSFDPSFDSVHNLLNHYRNNCLPMRQSTLSYAYSELTDNQ